MKNKKRFIAAENILWLVLIIILCCVFFQWYRVTVFDKKPLSIDSSVPSTLVNVAVRGSEEASDTWETVIQESDDPEDKVPYHGATCGIDIKNNQDHAIKDWTLEIDINNECYLNGFWCGSIEVHQFRNGKEITETVDSGSMDVNTTKLDHNKYSKEEMIRLLPGDYLIYHPATDVKEDYIDSGSTVGIGMIFYYRDKVDLSANVITYYNSRKFTDGVLFNVIEGMALTWIFFMLLHVVTVLTYKTTKEEVESLTQSVINGLSAEYKTIWLINTKKKTIELIRGTEEADVQKATTLAQGFKDYDSSMKYYVDHYVDEKDRERVWEAIKMDSLLQHMEDEKFYNIYYLHHPYKNVNVYFQMIFTRAGKDAKKGNIILAYRDVDSFVREEQQRKKDLEVALERAEAANRTKSIFLANMSHEIRTPINAVIGMDTMILREAQDESIKEYAKDIRNASNTLLSIINDILDFSKIESGKMELVYNNYQLDSVLNDLLNMIRPRYEDKGLEFEFNLNPETPAKLVGDEVRVKQIILNILTNAVKYTKQGKVTWNVDFRKASTNSCELIVSVKDTGIGIKPEEIDKLFSPYERLDSSQTRTIEGTGLGLNITQNLLNKMGSRLKVESVYGEGSEFSFRLVQQMWGPEPIGDNLTNTVVENEEKAESFHAPDAKILIVDDVEMNLIVVRSLLKRVQITPETVLSGAEAVELAQANKYDIIFLDAMMPGMSGEETLKHIRAEAEINNDTPIIVLTANAIVGAKSQYLAAGFSEYLSKPIDGGKLEDMIQKYLSEDKIILPGPNGFEKSEEVSNANEPYLKALGEIPEINVAEGIKASGGEDTYINICGNFYATAEERMQMITDYYDGHDADNYAIQTHALKSSARLVGALELSELSLKMELAGKAADWDQINESTAPLLEIYRSVSSKLKSAFETIQSAQEDQTPKKEMTEKKFKRNLKDFRELVEAYDFDMAKELFESWKEYKLPDDFTDPYNKIKVYMAEVDYDKIVNEITTYLKGRKES